MMSTVPGDAGPVRPGDVVSSPGGTQWTVVRVTGTLVEVTHGGPQAWFEAADLAGVARALGVAQETTGHE